MRVLGLIGLLLALLSVGWMAREQLGALGFDRAEQGCHDEDEGEE